jgi:hypothetical protein
VRVLSNAFGSIGSISLTAVYTASRPSEENSKRIVHPGFTRATQPDVRRPLVPTAGVRDGDGLDSSASPTIFAGPGHTLHPPTMEELMTVKG